jgi:hypothetical protein
VKEMAFMSRKWDDAAFLVRYSTVQGRGPHNLERLAKQQLLLTLQGGPLDPASIWHYAFPGEHAPSNELVQVSREHPIAPNEAGYLLRNLLENTMRRQNNGTVKGPALSLFSPFKPVVDGMPMPLLIELASELKQRFGVGWNHAATYYFLALSNLMDRKDAGAQILLSWAGQDATPEAKKTAEDMVEFLLLTKQQVLEPNKAQVELEFGALVAYMHVQLPEHYTLPSHHTIPDTHSFMSPETPPPRVFRPFGAAPSPSPASIPQPTPTPAAPSPSAEPGPPPPSPRGASLPAKASPPVVISTEPDAPSAVVTKKKDEKEEEEGDEEAEEPAAGATTALPESAKVDSVQEISAHCGTRPRAHRDDCYNHHWIYQFAQQFGINMRHHPVDTVYRCALIRRFSEPGPACRTMMRQYLPPQCADPCAQHKAPCSLDTSHSPKKWCRFLAPFDACDARQGVCIDDVQRFNALVNDSCTSGERVLSLAQQLKRYLVCHVGPRWKKCWQRLWGRPPCARTCTVVDKWLLENKHCIPPRTLQRIVYLAPTPTC